MTFLNVYSVIFFVAVGMAMFNMAILTKLGVNFYQFIQLDLRDKFALALFPENPKINEFESIEYNKLLMRHATPVVIDWIPERNEDIDDEELLKSNL